MKRVQPSPQPMNVAALIVCLFIAAGYITLSRRPPEAGIPITRIEKDENGMPFPAVTSYMPGYPQLETDGRAHVTVDNSQNNSDVFVKLYSLTEPPKPIRTFFIKAGDRFTTEGVRPGFYDVRYQDLSSGALVKTDYFELREINNGTSIQWVNMTVTLYTVADGNMKTHPISKSDF